MASQIMLKTALLKNTNWNAKLLTVTYVIDENNLRICILLLPICFLCLVLHYLVNNQNDT